MNRRGRGAALLVAFGGLLVGVGGAAGEQPAPGEEPPTVAATRIENPPRVDAVLDEPFWAAIPPVSGFRQRDPVDGAPASERTEVRIAYDESALYFGFVFFDSEPDRIRRNILHRGGRISHDDRVVIALDTYLDRRNAYIFEVGSLGTQDDALISDESMTLDDWNWDGVFTTETRVTEDGWVLEMAIPFTTIRFADTDAVEMGIAIQRSIRRKNENVYWPHIGQDYRSGIAQVSRYATLTGISGIRRGRHLEVKPFATLGAQQLEGEASFDRDAQAGLDLKYGLTSNLTLDLTWNTDFAQVETDNVQINLTRFDLFFPEKREFFLERAGLFQFGDEEDAEIFFSRRIGLEGDILGGGRLTGQAGPISVGALALRTEAHATVDGALRPAAWNSVLRLQGNLRERTTLGGIFTSLDADGGEHRRTLGADLVSRFWSSSEVRVWGARVADRADGELDTASTADASAAQADVHLRSDRYGLRLARTWIGRDFDPALGFIRRGAMDERYGSVEWRPRFEATDWARQALLLIQASEVVGAGGGLESRTGVAGFGFTFESGDIAGFTLLDRFERLAAPAAISGREIPVGDYRFRSWETNVVTNESRNLSGFAGVGGGSFWGGTRSLLRGGMAVKTGPHLTVGGSLNRNAISLPVPGGDFTTTLAALDIKAAVSRKLFANALIQWDSLSNELQANIRVDWIHTPGSDLFLVLDTGYLTDRDLDPRLERWTRRTGVMKLTWLRTF